MAPNLLKKECAQCGRSFFTYDAAMEFCNTRCEGRRKYEAHTGKVLDVKVNESNCLFCRSPIQVRGQNRRYYCDDNCKREDKKRKRLKNNKEVFLVGKPEGRRLPYHVLNLMEERKRLRDL